MSIKRTKQTNYGGRTRDLGGDDPFAKPVEPEKPWAEQLAGRADDAFVPYALAQKFEKGALLTHPKFGKGIVVKVEGPRIEVLFEEGTKKLGHGA